jgi:hypothetical protein
VKGRHPAVAALAVAAGLAALYGVAEAARGGGGGGDRGANAPLTITGDVEGLYPGGAAPLSLRIANPHPFDVTVSSLRVEVRDPGGGCPAATLSVDEPPVGTVLPRRSTATVPVMIRMPTTAPDACQGAAFPLEYTVTAVKSR